MGCASETGLMLVGMNLEIALNRESGRGVAVFASARAVVDRKLDPGAIKV